MISGSVNLNLEAIIPVVVIGPSSQLPIEAVLDTGFSGELTLPPDFISALQLTLLARGQAILADGSVHEFDIYRASVIWDGQQRSVEVEESDTEPLLGMTLLARHSIRIDVVNGGAVAITALP